MGLIAEILNSVFDVNEKSLFVTDYPRTTYSKPNVFTTALAQQTLFTPPLGKAILIKGITIYSTQNSGELFLKRGNGVPADPEVNTDIIIGADFSVIKRVGVSANVSILLDIDETLDVEIVGSINKDVFVGVSFRYVDAQDKSSR